MDDPNRIRESGCLTIDDVRQSGRPASYEVLVDTASCIIGGATEWCRVKKLRSPAARFEVEVRLPGTNGTGSYQAVEVQAVRKASA